MKKNILQRFYLCVFLLSSLGITKAQNMSKYVTITVEQGQSISFGLQAASANTPIKIVSGDEENIYTINNSWTNYQYAAPTTTITIYGDIIGLGCEENLTRITGLDVSHNPNLESLFCENNNISTLDVSQNSDLKFFYCADNNLTTLDVSQNMALEILNCHGNNFTTQAIDELMCKLPNRTGVVDGWIYLLSNPSDNNTATVLATNNSNATAKNWNTKYRSNNNDITGFTGTFDCASLSVEDIEVEDPTVTLYPNPVSDVLYVKANSKVETITVYAMTGAIVKEVEDADNIPMAHLPSATYIVKVKTAKGVMVKNVIKK